MYALGASKPRASGSTDVSQPLHGGSHLRMRWCQFGLELVWAVPRTC
jgi:hypothetical protein